LFSKNICKITKIKNKFQIFGILNIQWNKLINENVKSRKKLVNIINIILINKKVLFQTEKFRRKQKFKNLIWIILEIKHFTTNFFLSNLQQNFRILKNILIFEGKFNYEHIFAVRNLNHIFIFHFHQNLQIFVLISHFHFIDSFYNVGKILEFFYFFLIIFKIGNLIKFLLFQFFDKIVLWKHKFEIGFIRKKFYTFEAELIIKAQFYDRYALNLILNIKNFILKNDRLIKNIWSKFKILHIFSDLELHLILTKNCLVSK
jgi:hypothetical protein